MINSLLSNVLWHTLSFHRLRCKSCTSIMQPAWRWLGTFMIIELTVNLHVTRMFSAGAHSILKCGATFGSQQKTVKIDLFCEWILHVDTGPSCSTSRAAGGTYFLLKIYRLEGETVILNPTSYRKRWKRWERSFARWMEHDTIHWPKIYPLAAQRVKPSSLTNKASKDSHCSRTERAVWHLRFEVLSCFPILALISDNSKGKYPLRNCLTCFFNSQIHCRLALGCWLILPKY